MALAMARGGADTMPMGMEAVFPQWLWDVLPRTRADRSTPKDPPADEVAATSDAVALPDEVGTPRRTRRSELYARLVEHMKQAHGVRVHRWRSRTTGCAWQVHYTDGTTARLIEAPYPKGPVSCAVFLHEIGHHAIGFHRYKPRCLEEFMAWRWALDTMQQWGMNITPSVQRRVQLNLRYAVAKAKRRGLKNVPDELLEYAA